MSKTTSLQVLNRKHWDRPNAEMAMRCAVCPDRTPCGGIRPERQVLSCRDYCCQNPSDCSRVCDAKPRELQARAIEVEGFEFGTIRRFGASAAPVVPEIVPVIYHGSARRARLSASAVAVPLRVLVNKRCTEMAFRSRQALCRSLKLQATSSLVIDCIGRDRLIENFWAGRRQSGLVQGLAALRPEWVVVPNYSVLSDVPRWDNLYSMKRSLKLWAEFMEAGVPVALTLNARTDPDWDRWTDFIVPRPEVQAIAVEFATGARYAERRGFLRDHLELLGRATGGRLRMFVRGGRSLIPSLSPAFAGIHLLDTNPFMKAIHRRQLVKDDAGLRSQQALTLPGKTIEHLLTGNVGATESQSALSVQGVVSIGAAIG